MVVPFLMLQHGPHSGRVGVSFNVHCYIWNAFIVVINCNHVILLNTLPAMY